MSPIYISITANLNTFSLLETVAGLSGLIIFDCSLEESSSLPLVLPRTLTKPTEDTSTGILNDRYLLAYIYNAIINESVNLLTHIIQAIRDKLIPQRTLDRKNLIAFSNAFVKILTLRKLSGPDFSGTDFCHTFTR